ncbi:unnamed protein product [Nezara viridula]|uniref:Uncharacterized protein n=1 Tax=Nezara viridula TaxID=85310 RepID=A0A9P0HJA6_NEZVI|nr:unnamed protein product [Nezara viridula]
MIPRRIDITTRAIPIAKAQSSRRPWQLMCWHPFLQSPRAIVVAGPFCTVVVPSSSHASCQRRLRGGHDSNCIGLQLNTVPGRYCPTAGPKSPPLSPYGSLILRVHCVFDPRDPHRSPGSTASLRRSRAHSYLAWVSI